MNAFPLKSFLLAVGLATALCAGPSHVLGQPPAKSDVDKLKGDWMVVSVEASGIIAEIFGQVSEPEKIRTATFSDSQLTLKVDADAVRMAYRSDATTTPKSLDLTIALRKRKRATLQGIYELDGNHLKMYFDSFGEERPAKIPVKSKDPQKRFGRISVVTLRRIGADPKLDALDRHKAHCARNLATLAEIMYMHVQDKRNYPPAAIYSKDGKPLLSWRVALLERMDQGDLLKEFKLDEPWDSAHNKPLLKKMPALYALPGVETEPGMTFFQVFTGKGTLFESKEGLKFTDHLKSDGPHFMIVEAGEPIPWTKPGDLPYDPNKPLPKLGRLTDETFHAAFTFLAADRVQFIPKSTPETKLRSLIQWRVVGDR